MKNATLEGGFSFNLYVLFLNAPDGESVVFLDCTFGVAFIVTADGDKVCNVGRFFGCSPEKCGFFHVFVSEVRVALARRVE